MTDNAQTQRSYGCEFACGNPYDVILIQVSDGTTQFLCIPCFIKLASDVVEAMTDGNSEYVQSAMSAYRATAGEPPPGPTGKARGHNAPATSSDPDLFAAYDDVVTLEEFVQENTLWTFRTWSGTWSRHACGKCRV